MLGFFSVYMSVGIGIGKYRGNFLPSLIPNLGYRSHSYLISVSVFTCCIFGIFQECRSTVITTTPTVAAIVAWWASGGYRWRVLPMLAIWMAPTPPRNSSLGTTLTGNSRLWISGKSIHDRFILVSLALPMLRLLSSNAQGCKYFWKPSKPCHVGVHWIALTEYSQMSTYMLGFQWLFRIFTLFYIGQLSLNYSL